MTATPTLTATLTLQWEDYWTPDGIGGLVHVEGHVLQITDAQGVLVGSALYDSTEDWTPEVYDAALTRAGYQRTGEWTPDGDEHTCPVVETPVDTKAYLKEHTS